MGWSIDRIDLEVRVDPSEKRLHVQGVAHLILEIDRSYGPNLALNSRRPAMEFVHRDVPGAASVAVNKTHPSRSTVRMLVVRFEEPFAKGDSLSVPFAYGNTGSHDAASPPKPRQFLIGSTGALASWVEAWYPIPIPRLDKGEGFSARLVSARGETRFLLPAGWRAVSNGQRTSREETAGGVLETWETSEAVSRSFCAGVYQESSHQMGEREVRMLLTTPMDPDEAALRVETLGKALDAMEARFGPYPYESYAIAEVPSFISHQHGWGASSEQGFIMAASFFIHVEGGNLPLFAHEAAHGWWGNLVGTKGEGSLLCSESLAQYGAVVAIETVEGVEAATEFLKSSRPGYVPGQSAKGYFEIAAAGNDAPLARLRSGGLQHHMLSDAKGHWVYHMLRRRVGDDVFFGTLRGLIEKYGGADMSLDDVRSEFIAAAPEASLPRFFEDWLDRTGAPVLDVSWASDDEGMLDLHIRQVQIGEPYHLFVDIAIDVAGERVMHRVEVSDERTHVRLPVVGKPDDVLLDPDDALLLWKPEYGALPSTVDDWP